MEEALHAHGLEAYERLLLDVMRGDHLLFTRADEIEMLWERSADLLTSPPEPKPYPRGGWGAAGGDRPRRRRGLAAPGRGMTAAPAHYKRPGWVTRHVMNPAVAGLVRLGVSVWGARILEVPGRRSGSRAGTR